MFEELFESSEEMYRRKRNRRLYIYRYVTPTTYYLIVDFTYIIRYLKTK